MANVFENMIASGIEVAARINSTTVAYSRGAFSCEVQVIKGGKTFYVHDAGEFGLIKRPKDFLARASQLKEANLFPPEPGEMVVEGCYEHRVAEQDGEPCWRYMEGTGRQWIRIHSDLVSGD